MEVILSIAMMNGEEITFYEDITISGYGTYGPRALQVTKHEIPLKIARFIGVPYKKIFRGRADAEDKDGNVEIIYPTNDMANNPLTDA